MKKLVTTLIFITLLVSSLRAQYIVTKVSGRVKNSTGSFIKPGTELKPQDRLTWSSLNDKLWVVIIGKGEKVISPSPQAVSGNNALTELLVSALHQDSQSGSLSGRGEIIERVPDALHTDPNSGGRVIIDEGGKFLFDPKQYPQTETSTFFAEIEVPGEQPIIRKLKTDKDTLFLGYLSLITETIDPSIGYKLGYKRADGVSELVTSFTPYFDLTHDMESTIANTILAYSKTTATENTVRDSVYHNVYANVGKPNGLLFMALFEQYWQSKGQARQAPKGAVFTGAIFDKDAFASVPVFSNSINTSRAELPSNFSLRQYAPPIGNQGETGSCVAWATSYAARTISYAVLHGYSSNNHYELILSNTFSPDFIYNNIKTSSDCVNGTVMVNALTYMKTHGDIKKNSDFVCGAKYDETELNTARSFEIKDFTPLNPPGTTEQQLVRSMKQALLNKQPLPFVMIVTPGFSSVDYTGAWTPDEDDFGHLDDVKTGRDITPERHAMCVIGYNDGLNNGSFEVMNSWGTGYGRGAKGFYWINYDDFYKFLSEVYVIVDRVAGDDALDTPPPPAIKPLVVRPITFVPVKPAKSRLKGSLEYILTQPDQSQEVMPVVMANGGTGNNESGVARYQLSRPLHSGNRYQIKFDASQAAYVYIINMGAADSVDVLFPVKKNNESALINFNNSTLFLPNNRLHYILDNVTGTEKMCIMVSKSPIDIDELNSRLKNGQRDFYKDIKDFLGTRLMEIKPDTYSQDKVKFDTPAGDDDVLAFFLEIDHL